MAIKLGEQNIGKIMLGDRPIKKVMLGDRLVWHKDFEFLDSVINTTKSYIDTNIVMNDNIGFECKFRFLRNQSNTQIWNGYVNTGTTSTSRFGFQSGVIYNQRRGTGTLPNIGFDTNFHIYINEPNRIAIDDKTSQKTPTYLDNNMSFYLFSYNGGPNEQKGMRGEFGYITFYDNQGNTIAKIIPCQNKNTKEVGMYDMIGGSFYTNQGTGQFIGIKKNGDVALPNIITSLNFSDIDFSLENAIKILDALQPVATPQTITFSAYTTTLINESDVALGKVFDAIRKGWSIIGEGLIQTDDVAFFNDPETRMPTLEE